MDTVKVVRQMVLMARQIQLLEANLSPKHITSYRVISTDDAHFGFLSLQSIPKPICFDCAGWSYFSAHVDSQMYRIILGIL